MQKLLLDDLQVESFSVEEYRVVSKGTVEGYVKDTYSYGRCTAYCPDTKYEGDSCHGSCYRSDGHIC